MIDAELDHAIEVIRRVVLARPVEPERPILTEQDQHVAALEKMGYVVILVPQSVGPREVRV